MLTLALALSCLAVAPSNDTESEPPEAALAVRSKGLEALLSDPRDEGLARALGALEGLLSERAGLGPAWRFGLGLQRILSEPFVVRVGGTAGAPWAQLTSFPLEPDRARDHAAWLRELLVAEGAELASGEAGVQTAHTPMGALSFGASRRGDRFFVAFGGHVPEGARPGGEGAPELELDWDAEALSALVRPWMDDEQARRGWDWFAGRLSAGEVELTIEGTGAVWRSRQRLPRGEPRLTLSERSLERIPATATAAFAGASRPLELLEFADYADPGAAEQLERGFGAWSGLSAKGLLADLGPSAGAFTTSSAGGGLMSLVAFLETRNPEGVARSVNELIAKLTEGPAKGHVEVRRFEHAGVACQAFVFPGLPIPAEPSLAVADGAIYLAAHSNGLREALDQLAAEDSILDHPEVRAGAAGDRDSALAGFSFVDTPRFLEAGYGKVLAFVPMVENLARSPEGLGADIAPLLPTLKRLAEGSRPWVGRAWYEGDELVSRASFDRSPTAQIVALGGTPMVSGVAILSSVAVPKLMAARNSANEAAAIATLRVLTSAQAQLQHSGSLDVDGDGSGEYGYFGELSGTRSLRSGGVLSPAVLSSAFEPVDDGTGEGVVIRSGYVFKIFLPGPGRRCAGLAEPVELTRAAQPDPGNSEVLWAAYAWPLQVGQTGNRAFFVNQEGDLCFLARSPYSGLAGEGGRMPSFDAAFAETADMGGFLADGGAAADGHPWSYLE